LLVKQIETQKRAKNQTPPILLPKPERELTTDAAPADTLILSAIKKEVDRGLAGLKMEGLQSPFFISYVLGDIRQMNIEAANGSLMTADEDHSRITGSRLLMGNYQCTDENFDGTADGASLFGGAPILENDERGLRNMVRRDLDAIYKSAAETYEQKIATILQLNIPARELELADWDKTPVVRLHDLPKSVMDFDLHKYEDYVREASAVYNDYPEVLNSKVTMQLYEAKIYFYNTEGSEFVYPMTYLYLQSFASGQTEEGESLIDGFDFVIGSSDALPALDSLKMKCHLLAANLKVALGSPKMEEAYAGPVLFEELAAPTLVYMGFLGGSDLSLTASRRPLTTTGFSYGGNSIEEMMGKRITAREITIEDWTGTPVYNDVPLIGYAPVDGQGVVPPASLTLVENGTLMALLSDRVPTPKMLHSNGHALLTPGIGAWLYPGVIRLTDTRTKSPADLRKELLTRAKEEGYDYAYIVRDLTGSSPHALFRVSVEDGSEVRVRSAEIEDMDSQIFKKVIAVSDKEQIYNTLARSLVTVISPSAFLVDDMQIRSNRVDNFRKAPLTPNYFSSSRKEKP
jgi:hypothetical protein